MTFSTRVLRAGRPAGDAAGVEVPRPLGEDRVERLIAAARDLANDTGSAAFTVAQVAARAGLSLKSFYRCFRGKDDLLIALLAEESQIGAVLFTQLIDGRADPLEDPLRAFVDELFTLATSPPYAGYAGVLVREHRRLMECQPDEIRAALAPITDVIARHISTSDPPRDAQTVFTVLIGGCHDVVCGRVDDVAQYADYLYRFCAHGLDGTR
jgi:AcrR family transcriptional regulator